MRTLIASLVPAVMSHLEAYAELAGDDAREAATLLARRLAALLAAAVAGFVALLLACFWLVALAWDTPWRSWVAGGLALAFAVAAVLLSLRALRPKDGPPAFFARTRSELSRDRELLKRAFDGQRQLAPRSDGEHAAH